MWASGLALRGIIPISRPA